MFFVGLRCYISTRLLLISTLVMLLIVEISSIDPVMMLGGHWRIILQRFYFIYFYIEATIKVFKIFGLGSFLRWSYWSETFLTKILMKFIRFWICLILGSWMCRFNFGFYHTRLGWNDSWFFKVRLCNSWFGFGLCWLFFQYVFNIRRCLKRVIIFEIINKFFFYSTFFPSI